MTRTMLYCIQCFSGFPIVATKQAILFNLPYGPFCCTDCANAFVADWIAANPSVVQEA